MAKPSWITLSKNSGAGNDTFTITASKHTGREGRSGTVTVSGTGVTSKEIAVSQSGAAVYINTENTVSIAKGGSTINIVGQSNADGLKVQWLKNTNNVTAWNPDGNGTFENNREYETPALTGLTLSAGGASPTLGTKFTTQSNTTIQALGKQSAYDFAIGDISIPANPDNVAITRQLQVLNADGTVSKTITITQAAGDPTLSVSPTTVSLAAAGETKTITVTSNTSWSVS